MRKLLLFLLNTNGISGISHKKNNNILIASSVPEVQVEANGKATISTAQCNCSL